jgi:ankyrin repeat protein
MNTPANEGNEANERQLKRQRRLQNFADISTFVCAISYLGLVVIMSDPPSGGAGLVVVFPLILVVLLHFTLGISALISAVATGRWRRNLWVYLYFVTALISSAYMTGLLGGMVQNVKAKWERTNHQEALLYPAIASGNLPRIEQLVAEGVDLSYCFVDDWKLAKHSPLQYALQYEHPEAAAVLIAAGAKPDHVCLAGDGTAPIILAAEKYDLSSLEMLIAAGADVNPQHQRYTTVVMAMIGGNYSMPYPGRGTDDFKKRRDLALINDLVDRLIVARADADAKQGDYAPIHWAVILGDEQLVARLLKAGADPNVAGHQRRLALSMAIRYGEEQVVKLLMSSGRVELSGYNGYSALLAAAEVGDLQLVDQLLANGVDLTPFNKPPEYGVATTYGRVVLAETLSRALKAENYLQFDALIRAGADVNIPNERQQGQLLLKIFADHPVQFQKLLSAGADVNAKTRLGGTLLHFYAGCGNCVDPVKAMRELVKHGAEINALDYRGRTPLKIARRNRIRDTTMFLESLGALEMLERVDE